MTFNAKPAMVEITAQERKGNTLKVSVVRGEGEDTNLFIEAPQELGPGLLQMRLETKSEDGKWRGHAFVHLTPFRVRELHKYLGEWLEGRV